MSKIIAVDFDGTKENEGIITLDENLFYINGDIKLVRKNPWADEYN